MEVSVFYGGNVNLDNKPIFKQLGVKLALLFLLLSVLPAGIVVLVLGNSLKEDFRQSVLDSLMNANNIRSERVLSLLEILKGTLSEFSSHLEKDFNGAVLDRNGFVDGAPTQEFYKSQFYEHTLDNMNIIIGQSERYLVFSVILANGQELFRLDRTPTGIVTQPYEKLQNKAHRNYFIRGLEADRNVVYVHNITPQMENGKYIEPNIPTVRVISKIFLESGKLFGLVILNVNADFVLGSLKKERRKGFLVINEKGDYLHHWNSEIPFNKEHNLLREEPELKINLLKQDARFHYDKELKEFRIWKKVFYDQNRRDRYWVFMERRYESGIISEWLGTAQVGIAWVLVVLAIGLTIFIVLTRRLLSPLNDLTASIMKIGKGDLAVRVKVETESEIGEVAQAFNTMADLIEKSDVELRESIKETKRFATEAKMSAEELRNTLMVSENLREDAEAAKELAEMMAKEATVANRAKSIFLSSMSHELRTPLNSILGFSQLISTDTTNPLSETQQKSMSRVLHSGEHLLKLIDDVLDLSKIETGKITISIEDVHVASVVRDSISAVMARADKNRITIDSSGVDPDVFIRADITRFRQVMINLMSNATKYNRVGGSVFITTQILDQGMLRISVKDTGQGIAAENMESLFKPFNRLGMEGSNIEGTGIGLTITKRIIENMNGRINVDSEPGKGTEFSIDFHIGDNPVLLLDDDPEFPEAGVGKKITGMKTILYVEDNPSNLALVENILERRDNITLLTSVTGRNGVELAVNSLPDIILMDIDLPDIDGYEALEMLRSYEKTSNIPVVAISANAMPSDIKKGERAGFAHYLTKPININRFLDIIDASLSGNGQ